MQNLLYFMNRRSELRKLKRAGRRNLAELADDIFLFVSCLVVVIGMLWPK